MCWPTLLTFPLTFRIVAAAVASDRWPTALGQHSSVVAARGDTKDQSSHHTFSLFGYRQLRITQSFFFLPCTWDTWHLAAGSLARQMSVIDILGMRLDFMICLFKKEMSSVTENGINGGKRRDNQTGNNWPVAVQAGLLQCPVQ